MDCIWDSSLRVIDEKYAHEKFSGGNCSQNLENRVSGLPWNYGDLLNINFEGYAVSW